MDYRLRVLVGSSVGQELPVSGPQFIIGRGEGCQLRARSDAIGRQHCALTTDDQGLRVRDLGSKNGTFVNDVLIEGERVLKAGDKLRMGPLEFEICVRASIASDKRPKVKSVREAATRTAQSESRDVDIDGWLSDDHAAEAPESSVASRGPSYFQADAPAASSKPVAEQPAKGAPGKLPPVPASSGNSRDAAAETLNKISKMMKRR